MFLENRIKKAISQGLVYKFSKLQPYFIGGITDDNIVDRISKIVFDEIAANGYFKNLRF